MPQTLRFPGGVEDRGTRSLHQRARQQSPEDRKPTDGAVASPADSSKKKEETGSLWIERREGRQGKGKAGLSRPGMRAG